MTATAWGDLAGWYDKKQGDEGDLWHRTYLDPALFAVIGEVRGRQILDVPCGNGHNTRRLARMGNLVTGLDVSEPIIAIDQAREERETLGITYLAADAAATGLPDNTFDLVVSQMGLMDIPDAAGAVREMSRVMKPQGRLVALFCHPCFDVPGHSAWVWEKVPYSSSAWRKIQHYAQPFAGQVPWNKDGETIYTTAYHRPLSWYMHAIRAAGLVLTDLHEPIPPPEFVALEQPDGPWMTDVPLHIILEARKLVPHDGAS